MFFNSAINPKSACLTTLPTWPKLQSNDCLKCLLHMERPLSYFNSLSFHLFGLKVHQFAPENEFSSPHPIYIYSQLSDFMGWLSSLAQANLTSLSSESDAVIFGGSSSRSHVGSEQTSQLHLLLEALPLGTKQASRLISPRAPSATYKLEPPSSPRGFCRGAPSAGVSTRSAFEGTPVPSLSISHPKSKHRM